MINNIVQLEVLKERIIERFSKLDELLSTGKITREQYNNYIIKFFGGKNKDEIIKHIDKQITQIRLKTIHKKIEITSIITLLVIFAVLLSFLFKDKNITGFVVFNKTTDHSLFLNQTLNESTQIYINETNISSFRITATHLNHGQIEIYLEDSTGTFEVYKWSEPIPDKYKIITSKKTYFVGEKVDFEIIPQNTTYSVYLYHNNDVDVIEAPFIVTDVGNYTLKAIFNDSGNIEIRSTSFDVIEYMDSMSFSNEIIDSQNESQNENEIIEIQEYCKNTCNIVPPLNSPIILKILLNNTEIKISKIDYKTKINNEPIQIKNIPTIIFTNTTQINLSNYFEDPDGDKLFYDISNISSVNAKIEDDILTLSSLVAGRYSARVYVNDLLSMIESNEFNIIVKNNQDSQEKNMSEDDNISISNITPEKRELYECLHQNKNKRPKFCMIGKESEYFDDNKYYLVNSIGQQLGTIMPNGDLLIKGNVITNSYQVPGEYSFEIKNSFGETTIWIDPINYNLYLRGDIFVNQEILSWDSRFDFIVKNTKGLYLAVFDAEEGNLYLRGVVKNE